MGKNLEKGGEKRQKKRNREGERSKLTWKPVKKGQVDFQKIGGSSKGGKKTYFKKQPQTDSCAIGKKRGRGRSPQDKAKGGKARQGRAGDKNKEPLKKFSRKGTKIRARR